METELTVDARGLACPIPVVRARKALDGLPWGRVVVLVDEPAARENLARLAAHMGCGHECEAAGEGFRITLTKRGEAGGRP